MALLPEIFMKSTVAIYGDNNDGSQSLLGTGFIYGRFIKKEGDESERYIFYLVTCRHVIEDDKDICLKFVKKGMKDLNLKIDRYNGVIHNYITNYWYEHPKKDLDVVVIPLPFAETDKYFPEGDFIRNHQNVAQIGKMKELGITEGDYIYVIGYPNELVSDKKDKLIARNGTIAHISSLYDGESDDFVIDSFIFPGNSGGPVILKPESLALAGTKPYQQSYILGIVCNYYSYQERAILRTNQSRVLFEDNSGLGAVYPIDIIEEIMDYHLEQLRAIMKSYIDYIKVLSEEDDVQKYLINQFIEQYKEYIKENRNIPPQIIRKLLKTLDDNEIFELMVSMHKDIHIKKIGEMKRIFTSPFVDFYLSHEEVEDVMKIVKQIEKSFKTEKEVT